MLVYRRVDPAIQPGEGEFPLTFGDFQAQRLFFPEGTVTGIAVKNE